MIKDVILLDTYMHAVPGVPYNTSIAAVNRAGIGEFTSFVNFSQQLGADN
jgi:hypothetical protein